MLFLIINQFYGGVLGSYASDRGLSHLYYSVVFLSYISYT
nr:MAG TPA: hypothetical protein [Caudoviricetes sp.]DAJ04221.1 MAG TPA: hypothetical protein [Caudoviricetes sp.]DAZ58886.1 MAG TPA: hypothetical protein [Caudoviricetes sp.]